MRVCVGVRGCAWVCVGVHGRIRVCVDASSMLTCALAIPIMRCPIRALHGSSMYDSSTDAMPIRGPPQVDLVIASEPNTPPIRSTFCTARVRIRSLHGAGEDQAITA